MVVVQNALGALLTGAVIGFVKGIRGNTPATIESGIILLGASVIDYILSTKTDNKYTAFFDGVEAAASSIFVTEVTNVAQVAKQLWVPQQVGAVELG